MVTWGTFATVWGEINPLIGREYLEARQEGAELPVKIRIRYLIGVEPTMRVKWTDEGSVDHYYYLEAPAQNVEGRRREMLLMAREQVQ
jgi:SPP1 family predicted phage head-tail adaptor